MKKLYYDAIIYFFTFKHFLIRVTFITKHELHLHWDYGMWYEFVITITYNYGMHLFTQALIATVV